VDQPNLNESAWGRAVTATARVYRTSTFWVGVAIVGVIAAGVAVIVTDDPHTATQTKVAVPIVIGVAALGAVLVGAFLVQLALAPVQQRNELRRDWPTEPLHGPVNVETSLRNYSRQMLDMANGTWYDDFQQDSESLHNKATAFLSEHAPDLVKDFTGTTGANVWETLTARGNLLATFADRLSND
jgi:hypothetical protein